eukprot:1192444-Prorocentrum_minimum.AAC.3
MLSHIRSCFHIRPCCHRRGFDFFLDSNNSAGPGRQSRVVAQRPPPEGFDGLKTQTFRRVRRDITAW